jgi:4-hydroxybenzoate polyprenyltransferase
VSAAGPAVAAAPEPSGGIAGLVREVVIASRPLSWINTALPFLAAALAVTREVDLAVLLGFAYFLVPFNLLMYGVNDIFDYESDLRNPRKRSAEGGLVPPDRRRAMWVAIVVTNVPLLVALAAVAPTAGTIAALVAAAAAVVYSAPPLRTKERPFLDSVTSSSHFVLPAVTGFLVAGLALDALPWPLLGGFFAWGIASHAVGAVQDIAYDRAAGIGSIATAAGPRATAAIALAGYAIAVVAPASHGPLGLIASAALAPYLLLPLAILSDPSETQARRAWRSFLGFNFLAGFVLTQVLLAAWGAYTQPPAAVVAFVTVVAAAVPLALLVAAEIALRRPAPADGARADVAPTGATSARHDRVTVVVPCRDEASNLPAVLAAIAAQDHPDVEIVVADDGSSDGSAGIARDVLAGLRPEGADRVLDLPPKPAGWAGKSWACDRGAAAATGTEVLFLDADTVLTDPAALRRLSGERRRTGAALVSGVTTYAMPTLAEQVCIPQLPMTIFGFLPLALLRLTGGRPAALAFAYGPLLFVDRAAYVRSGGHAAAPGSEREDVDLARTIVRSGGRVGVVRAAGLARTRHYPEGRSALTAWRRVFVAFGGGAFAVPLASLAGTTLAWILPLVLPLLGFVLGDATLLQGGLLALAFLAAFRIVLAIREGMPLRTVLWHPLTVAVTTAAQILSLVDAVRGRPARWRGRTLEGDAS